MTLVRAFWYVLTVITYAVFVVLAWLPLKFARWATRDRLVEERKKWRCEPEGACDDHHPGAHCWTHAKGPPKRPKEIA